MEVAEGTKAVVAAGYTDEGCPFCGEKPLHDSETADKKKMTDKVKSVPSDLGCKIIDGKSTTPKRSDGDLPFTMARHHLISAKQCYAKLKPLVRMASSVGDQRHLSRQIEHLHPSLRENPRPI